MRLNYLNHLFTVLMDPADAPAGGGAPAAGTPAAGTPAAGTPAAGTPSAAATPGTGTPPAGTPASPSATGFSYKEDRSDWVPRHRLNEASGKTTTLQTQVDTLTRQLQALTGVTPQDPNAAKSAQVREAFASHFPHLKPLLEMTPEQIARLTSVPDVAARVQSADQRQWQRIGNQVMNRIATDVAEAMGVEKLDDDQRSDLRTTFSSWFKNKVAAEIRESVRTTGSEESATLDRYENGDEELLKDFITGYTKRWVEPARRTATAQTAGRIRPVPNSTGRAQVTSVDRPAKFNSLDERLDYAAKLAKERGVQFGR